MVDKGFFYNLDVARFKSKKAMQYLKYDLMYEREREREREKCDESENFSQIY